MSMLGTLVVRIVANMVGFKGDLDKAAKDTADAAAKIEGSTSKAGAATGGLADKLEAARKVAGAANGDLLGAAQGAQALSAGAGVAVIGVGLLVAGLAAAAYAAHTGAQESKAYDKALILTGNAAGTNASQMQAMAAGIDKVVGTQAQAAAGLAQMAGTGLVAGNNLQKFTQVAIEMERGVGVAVGDTVKQFAALGADPVKASLRLNETTNYLTASTFAQIKAAEELGDKELAASLAQNAYADAMAVRTAKIAANVGTLEKIWKGLGDVAAWAWDKMLGIGRENGPEQVLEKAKAGLANLKKLDVERRAGAALGSLGGELPGKIAAAEKEVALAQETVKLSQRASQLQADALATQKAKVAWDESGNKFLTERQKKDAEILLVRNQGLAALASEEDIQKRIAVIEAKGASARAGKPKVDKSDAIELAKQEAILSKLAGVNADYQQQLTRLQSIRAKGNISEAEYLRLVNELIGKQPMAKKLIDDHTKATELMAKANLAGADAHRKYVDSLEDGAGKLEKEVQQLREHNERIGLGKVAVAELDAAKLEATANTLESFAIRELDKNLNEAEYELTKRQIAALRDKAALTREGAGKEVAVDQAKKASEAWNKTAGDIQKDLTDSLMRGFEKGKTFAENLRDTVVNMFKTMVLRPTVSAIVNAGANAIGLGGSAGAGAGSGGGLAGLSGISNIASSLGSVSTVAGQVIAGGMSIANAFGTVAANISGTGLTGLLATNGAFGTAAGAAGGAGLMSGIGAAINAIPVWGQIAFATAAIASLLGGKKDSRYGSQYEYVAGSETRIAGGPNKGVDFGNQKQAQDVVIGTINSLLTRVGSSQQVGNFASGFESSEKGKGFSYAGGTFANGVTFGQGATGRGFENNRGSKTPDQAIAEYKDELTQATLQALQSASDLPKIIANQLKGVDIDALTGDALKNFAAAIDKQIADVENFRTAVQGLPFAQLRDLSFDAAAAMLAAGGGLEALSANLGTYYDNFYDEEEKRAQTIGEITRALNAGGVNISEDTIRAISSAEDGRAQFRALVEGYGAATEANAPMLNALYATSGAFAALTPAAEATATAIEKIDDGLKPFLDTIARLEIELARKQGDVAGADAYQYQIDTAGLTVGQRALFDHAAALRTQIAAVDAATAAAEAAANQAIATAQASAAQREGLETRLLQLQGNTVELRNRELAAIAPANQAMQMLIWSIEDMATASAAAAAVDAQRRADAVAGATSRDNRLGAANKAVEAAQADIDKINAAKLQSDKAAQANIDKINAAKLQSDKAAAQASKQAAQQLAGELRSVFDLLDGQVRDLYGAVDSTRMQAASEGNAFIDRALASAQTTGYLPDSKELASAIQAARAGIDADNFATQNEFVVAQLVLAGKLDQMKGISGSQLTQADRAVAAADTQITYLEGILDATATTGTQTTYLEGILGATTGTQVGLMSMSDALAALARAMAAQTIASAAQSAGNTKISAADIRDYVFTQVSTGLQGETQIYNAAKANGISSGQLEAAMGWTPGRANEWAKENGLPSFAVGTDYVPRDMLAMIHEGEEIVPKAFNPNSPGNAMRFGRATKGGMSNSGNSDAAIDRLTAKFDALNKELEKVTKNTGATAYTLDKVTDGGNAMKSEVMA